ncbi:hypothetical protein [Crocosphaera chwakensis]|uniref:Uncharacterized protein n=1 Tax=Crocosphaera chwakensis CCY0110 TaxID=391612 RepID=A3IW90_9CHRO|nr:hypothetical protein [Crocosphaera chwakensis]EAZ89264.1 hypothetical protein CY0110_07926 [Crocosphaera chwakensis CCY0110]
MNKKTDTPITSLSPESHKDAPWWNRSVIGEDSLVEDLLGKFSKQEVSESALFLHNREMTDLRVFAKTAETIDNDKFGQEEFLIFVKMQYLLRKGLHEYQGLYESLQLLKVAIDAKDCFISIDQTELRYRGTKQQEFYNFVERLLLDHENAVTFREQVQMRLADLLPQIKTEEGRTALQNYAKYLDQLSDNELGLKLLSLFKTYQLADYSILRIISNLIQSLGKKDLLDFKGLVSLVRVNYGLFEKLRDIIGLSERQSTPETYGLMIQFIALANRHGISHMKFDDLIKVMQKWYKPYQAVIGIRQEHPPSEYKQPKEFKEAIPGIEIYEKYRKWLTDKKTGMVFIDFGDDH